jgi:hypothetical protein
MNIETKILNIDNNIDPCIYSIGSRLFNYLKGQYLDIESFNKKEYTNIYYSTNCLNKTLKWLVKHNFIKLTKKGYKLIKGEEKMNT